MIRLGFKGAVNSLHHQFSEVDHTKLTLELINKDIAKAQAQQDTKPSVEPAIQEAEPN